MSAKNKCWSRRDFLRTIGITGAGSLLAPAMPLAEAADEILQVPTRPFGKTGWKLPILAYGGAALPKAWHNPLSTEDRVKLVRYAYDRGLRYFDTAGNYMESQAILGEGLKDVRDDAYLVTKVEIPADQVRRLMAEDRRPLETRQTSPGRRGHN